MKIKNIETDEVLNFSDDWEVVEEKKKAKIKGETFIDLFKHWAKANGHGSEFEKIRKQFIYNKEKDMLFYKGYSDRASYGIGFYSYIALEDLKDGEVYSYNDLVGEA